VVEVPEGSPPASDSQWQPPGAPPGVEARAAGTTEGVPVTPPGRAAPNVPIWVLVVVVLVAAAGITTFLLVRNAKSNERAERAEFDRLLTGVERIENSLEAYSAATKSGAETFGAQLRDASGSPSEIFRAVRTFRDNAYEQQSTLRREVVKGEAELRAMKFSSDKYDGVRNSMLQHADAWLDASDGLVEAIDAFLSDGSRSFPDELESRTSSIEPRIRQTFADVCSTLGKLQPSEKEFGDRIVDICDD